MTFYNHSIFQSEPKFQKSDVAKELQEDDFVKARHAELLQLKSSNNWGDVRTADNFSYSAIDFGFGKRNVCVPLQKENNLNLQDSRGNTIELNQSLSDYLQKIQSQSKRLDPADQLRILELDEFLRVSGATMSNMSLCEIGFRNPRLLTHYTGLAKCVKGYDISEINVRVAALMGFDCSVWDLNDMDYTVVGAPYDLVLCYHVLEHTHNPVESLRKIRGAINAGGLLHIEIPVEPGMPRIQFGHLIALERGDLQSMAMMSGFRIENVSYQTHSRGPEIERIIARAVSL